MQTINIEALKQQENIKQQVAPKTLAPKSPKLSLSRFDQVLGKKFKHSLVHSLSVVAKSSEKVEKIPVEKIDFTALTAQEMLTLAKSKDYSKAEKKELLNRFVSFLQNNPKLTHEKKLCFLKI